MLHGSSPNKLLDLVCILRKGLTVSSWLVCLLRLGLTELVRYLCFSFPSFSSCEGRVRGEVAPSCGGGFYPLSYPAIYLSFSACLFRSFATRSYSVTKGSLTLEILMLQPPKCWNVRIVSCHTGLKNLFSSVLFCHRDGQQLSRSQSR